jgi:hypothetical protein
MLAIYKEVTHCKGILYFFDKNNRIELTFFVEDKMLIEKKVYCRTSEHFEWNFTSSRLLEQFAKTFPEYLNGFLSHLPFKEFSQDPILQNNFYL